MSIIIVLLLLY